jgi:hypothetical protein
MCNSAAASDFLPGLRTNARRTFQQVGVAARALLLESAQLPGYEEPQAVTVSQHVQQATQMHVLEPMDGPVRSSRPQSLYDVLCLAQRPADFADSLHATARADHGGDPSAYPFGEVRRRAHAVGRRSEGEQHPHHVVDLADERGHAGARSTGTASFVPCALSAGWAPGLGRSPPSTSIPLIVCKNRAVAVDAALTIDF